MAAPGLRLLAKQASLPDPSRGHWLSWQREVGVRVMPRCHPTLIPAALDFCGLVSLQCHCPHVENGDMSGRQDSIF